MAQTGGYPTGSPATTATVPVVQNTSAAQAAGFAVYNNDEIDVLYTGMAAMGSNSFLAVLLGEARSMAGGNYSDQGIGEKTITNYPKHTFKELDDVLRVYTLNTAGITNGSITTFVLNTTSGLQAGDLLRNTTTNERIRVQSITNTTTFEAARGFGSIAAAAMANGATFIFEGNAMGTSTASRTGMGAVPQDRDNYIQKIVETCQITDEDSMSNKVTTKFVEDIMRERLVKHGRDLEYAAIFGQKKSNGVDAQGNNVYTTEGALQTALRGWTGDISSGLTNEILERELSRPFQYGSSTKIGLCGRKAKAKIRSLFENRINVSTNETVNLKFSQIDMNSGTLILVDHMLMDADSGYDSHIIIVDPSTFKVVYPSGVDLEGNKVDGHTRFIFNTAESTFGIQKGDYRTYIGFENAVANAMGVFKVV